MHKKHMQFVIRTRTQATGLAKNLIFRKVVKTHIPTSACPHPDGRQPRGCVSNSRRSRSQDAKLMQLGASFKKPPKSQRAAEGGVRASAALITFHHPIPMPRRLPAGLSAAFSSSPPSLLFASLCQTDLGTLSCLLVAPIKGELSRPLW